MIALILLPSLTSVIDADLSTQYSSEIPKTEITGYSIVQQNLKAREGIPWEGLPMMVGVILSVTNYSIQNAFQDGASLTEVKTLQLKYSSYR